MVSTEKKGNILLITNDAIRDEVANLKKKCSLYYDFGISVCLDRAFKKKVWVKRSTSK